MLAAAREAGLRIVFMRHLSMPKELMGVVQFRMAIAWQRVERAEDVHPWFLRDAPGFPIAPELIPRTSEAILDKITMSAFEGTPLTSCCATRGSMRLQLSAWPPRSASSPPFATASISATSRSSSETLAARGTLTPAIDRSATLQVLGRRTVHHGRRIRDGPTPCLGGACGHKALRLTSRSMSMPEAEPQ